MPQSSGWQGSTFLCHFFPDFLASDSCGLYTDVNRTVTKARGRADDGTRPILHLPARAEKLPCRSVIPGRCLPFALAINVDTRGQPTMIIMLIISSSSRNVNENPSQSWYVWATVLGTWRFIFTVHSNTGVQDVEAFEGSNRFDTVQVLQKRCFFPAHYHDVFQVSSPTHSCSADSRFCRCLIPGRTSDTSFRGMYLHELKAKPITLRYLYPQLFCCPSYGPDGHPLNRQQVGPFNIFC